MEDTHNNQKQHALLVTYPLQGHINPSINLAITLAKRGFTITFLNTLYFHHQITKPLNPETSPADYDIFSHARRQDPDLDIRYETVTDGYPISVDRTTDDFGDSFMYGFGDYVDEFVNKLVRVSQPPLTCLIADTFYPWTPRIAKKYGLVNVSFWTETALVFNIFYHLDLLRINGHFGCPDKREDTIDYIPGVEVFEPKDLMSHVQIEEPQTTIHRIIYKSFEEVKNADIVICNTAQELESKTIAVLQDKLPFYAIGPVVPCGFTKGPVESSLWSESDCTHWLDTKPKGSVLYVSFGSVVFFSKNEIHEIAHALLLSKVRFIWVLRPGSVSSEADGEDSILPPGFEDDVRKHDQGLIVPWCSQVTVLSHQAIGGFTTHCGWNSVLESMWSGVPMLCFPMFADQFTNRKLVVDDWKIGINLCDYKEPIARQEAASRIKLLMQGKLDDYDLRTNATRVKETLHNALSSSGGSSEKNLTQFFSDLNKKTHSKKIED